jgi:hypothetical protein
LIYFLKKKNFTLFWDCSKLVSSLSIKLEDMRVVPSDNDFQKKDKISILGMGKIVIITNSHPITSTAKACASRSGG